MSKRHGQTADKGRTAADDLNGQGRGCAPRSAGHTVPMNDPEAKSKNAPQEKSPPWLKWWMSLFIVVGGCAQILFIVVVGVCVWASFYPELFFGLFLRWLYELFANWFVESWRT